MQNTQPKTKLICHNDTRFTADFAEGCGATTMNLYNADLKELKEKAGYNTAVLTGFGRLKLIMRLEKAGFNYFFIDRGYVIDEGTKEWLRVSYNSFQMNEMRDISSWRGGMKVVPAPWKKVTKNSPILICPPCYKAAKYWGFNKDKWLETTVRKIKKYSDRKIIIRDRPAVMNRYNSPMSLKAAAEKAHIVVVCNSNAAAEAIFHGTPALVLGEAASKFVSINKIKNIEKPIMPDREMWLKNLMYHQFRRTELKDGSALRYLMKFHNLK